MPAMAHDDPRLIARVLVPCPTCGAAPAEWCKVTDRAGHTRHRPGWSNLHDKRQPAPPPRRR